MKSFYSIVILAFVLVSCGGNNESQVNKEEMAIDSNYCDCNKLIFDEGYNHFYRFKRREPFTGKCETFYPNGQVKMEKNFVEGKVHGPLIEYHDNGQVHVEQEFDMNLQVGEYIVYTKSGKVKWHSLYKNGKQTELIESNPQLDIND